MPLAAEQGWRVRGPTDDGPVLRLAKDHEGASWSILVRSQAAEQGRSAEVDLDACVADVEISPDEG